MRLMTNGAHGIVVVPGLMSRDFPTDIHFTKSLIIYRPSRTVSSRVIQSAAQLIGDTISARGGNGSLTDD